MPPQHVGMVRPLYAHGRPGDLLHVPVLEGDGLDDPVLDRGLHVGGEERPPAAGVLHAAAPAAHEGGAMLPPRGAALRLEGEPLAAHHM